jgi:signal transduction histidine kinase/ligand-binding sensor domain-containing protein/CheY-like chemotaxis protein
MGATLLRSQHYLFRQFGQQQGLKNLAIRCLLQDKIGFIWVGTENGLYRFDGSRFLRYGTSDGLPGDTVEALEQTEDGTLWIGTARGVATLREGVFQSLRPGYPTVHNPQSIASDGKNTVFIAAKQGLLRVKSEGGHWDVVPVSGAPSGSVNTVLYEDGKLWFTTRTPSALWLLDGSRLTRFGQSQGLAESKEWGGIRRDAHGDLYVRSQGLVSVLRAGATRFQLARVVPSWNWTNQLALDLEGNLAIPTDQGILHADGSVWVGSKRGLPDDPISCLLVDREGNPWIGTATQGLFFWAGAHGWEGYSNREGLSSNIVTAIFRDSAGTLWIGTRRGLDKVTTSGVKNVSHAPWTNQVRAIRQTPDGALWIASHHNGLARLDPVSGKATVFGAAEGLADNRLIGLDLIDGRLWAYTQSGVFVGPDSSSRQQATAHNTVAARAPATRFNRWEAIERIAPETLSKPVYRVQRDQRGRLWAATLAGLYVIDGNHWKRFGRSDGLLEDAVSMLAIDHQDRVWIGYSSDIGVSRLAYDENRFKLDTFTQRNPLGSNVIGFVSGDSKGRIWIGTDTGVDVWQQEGWRHYDDNDGLIWPDTTFNGFFADTDGSVWIGTNGGVGHFRTDQELRPKVNPEVAITGVEVNGEQIATSRIPDRLSPGSIVKIHFAVLSFRERRNVRFRYRLVGVDTAWIEDQDGDAVLLNLGNGHYRFEVQAYHPSRGWVTSTSSLQFEVAPYWWQTKWAAIAGLLLFAAIIIICWRLRVRVLVARTNQLADAVSKRTAEIQEEKATVEKQKSQIEQLLTETQRGSQLKDEFLANMSHEIRTPLHGVLGMTSLALGTRLTPEQREYLEASETSAKSLLHLLNDILDFSKIEAGKLALQPVPFRLTDCVDAATSALSIVARQKGLDFEVMFSENLPAVVTGDPDRLRQVLANLVNNAVKFTDEGSVQVRIDQVHSMDSIHHIRMTIKDTGMGIPQSEWAAIFEPFRQVDGSTTRRFGGTGLGLSICSRLVKQMRGELTLDSEVGRGTTFSLVIPMTVPADGLADVPKPAENDRALNQRLKILLVEDNAVNQRLGIRLLEREGCSVVAASSGEEALQYLSETEFDLVLMDVQMPDMDGVTATRELRRREGSRRRTPVVMLTASATPADRQRAHEAGADAYLLKPVQLEELRRAMAEQASINFSTTAPAQV